MLTSDNNKHNSMGMLYEYHTESTKTMHWKCFGIDSMTIKLLIAALERVAEIRAYN